MTQPKKRGRKPYKRRPVVLFKFGHIQLVWMRKPR